jgi:hypothetical protein
VPTNLEPSRSQKPSLARRGAAVVVFAVAAVIVFHFVVHIVLWLVTVVVVLAAIGAIVWAGNQLL